MKFRIALALSFAAGALSAADAPTPRPLTVPDIVAWKRIQAPAVSHNGEWFAYRLAPFEGNAEVVIRNLKTGNELRFPIGDPSAASPVSLAAAPAPPPAAALAAAGGDPLLSADGRWVVFRAYPTTQQAKRLRRDRRPIQARAVLVELATGKKTEFEKVRRFAFNGDLSNYLALQRYGAADGPGPGAGAAPAAGPANAAAAADRPTGTDLLLYELATGAELNIGNVSDFAFDKKGNWFSYLIDATDKAGNGIELRNMATGATQPLDSAQASYRSLSWTEKGDALATLRGADDKAFADKLYTLVAFKDFGDAGPGSKIVFDPKSDSSFPAGMTISSTRPPVWREDLSEVTFGIHEVKAKKKNAAADAAANQDDAAARPAPPTPDQPDLPDVVIWHYKDPRLQTQQQVQENADKNFSYLCAYSPSSKKFVRLADESLRTVNLTPQQRYAFAVDIRDYEREGNLDGRRYEDIYVVDPSTGQRKLALKKGHYVMGPSPDGTKFLYYDDGVFYAYDMETGKSTDLTSKIPTKFWDTEDDHNVVKPPRQSLGWSKDSAAVVLSDGWDLWKVPVAGGQAENLTVNGTKDKIRYRRIFRLDPEERGIDLDKAAYVSVYGEWTKKGGIGLIEPGKPGVQMLQWGDAEYSQLIKAKSADIYLYTRENTVEYPNYYVTTAALENGKQVTDANPQQKDFLWPKGVKLVDYSSTRGEKLQAALWLPANYQPGKHYPTIVYIYEKLSQGANAYPQPGYNGFNIAHYTSNGYAVLEPDIVYKVNDPGMSAVACVVPAVKAAIATGIVDAAAVGLQGHSWGGYQTAFLVTQTDIFHAAIAGAPLTDMVSMYSLIYRNTGGTNQAIFESSQGRFAGGYWDNMEAYIRNSPVYHAKSVKTPLIILANDKDGAVDQTQGIAYFNTLRRLDKPVILLEYKGENHGLRLPKNMKDYTVRMREWFDHYLKDAGSPDWMEKGVPLLQMKDHLEPRVTEMEKPAEAKPAVAAGGGGNGR
jgi:dipeptidyl aminopeptidase/acylaminoacyl peptidase